MIQNIVLFIYPWYPVTIDPFLIAMLFSGFGSVPDLMSVSSSDFVMLSRSVILTLSRALLLYPENDKKEIIPRIESIVITTMSSTSVKAFWLRIKINNKLSCNTYIFLFLNNSSVASVNLFISSWSQQDIANVRRFAIICLLIDWISFSANCITSSVGIQYEDSNIYIFIINVFFNFRITLSRKNYSFTQIIAPCGCVYGSGFSRIFTPSSTQAKNFLSSASVNSSAETPCFAAFVCNCFRESGPIESTRSHVPETTPDFEAISQIRPRTLVFEPRSSQVFSPARILSSHCFFIISQFIRKYDYSNNEKAFIILDSLYAFP